MAEDHELSFLDNLKYRDQFHTTKAAVCFVSAALVAEAPKHVRCLVSDNPYKAYALTAQALYPSVPVSGKVSPKSVIHKTAKIASNVTIEPGVVIAENVEIGSDSHIGANTVIGAGVIIGDHVVIGPNVTLSHVLIGQYVRIYPGVRIGQDGFGFAIGGESGHVKVPQLGRVIIGDHIEIGANTTIDRGAGPDTVIGSGTWIDNLVQIGHNVQVGKGCVIVAQVGISGSTIIEDFAMIGGQAGLAGHLRVGKGARIAAQSGIMRDVPAGEEHMGSPAMPIRQFMRQVGALNRLIKKRKSA